MNKKDINLYELLNGIGIHEFHYTIGKYLPPKIK